LPKDKIVFTIVGGDFFRKGGREILSVFNALIPQCPQLYLNIVSTLNFGDYASHTTKEDYNNALRIIEKYPEHIKHYHRLPNSEVLELLKKTHVGLLPTWADSFGYSVLEAQAAGCPVITTDIRALPEINNNEIGWIIPVPKLPSKNGDIDSSVKREEFSETLKSGLENVILEIMYKPESVEGKGQAALQKVKGRSKS